MIARAANIEAAAAFLGHGSTAITEDHDTEPDRTIDLTPAGHLERALRPVRPSTGLSGLNTTEVAECLEAGRWLGKKEHGHSTPIGCGNHLELGDGGLLGAGLPGRDRRLGHVELPGSGQHRQIR